MATEDDADAGSVNVQTYVPAYQRDEWRREADELDMSLSEFVKTMVQAGRSDISPEAGDREPDGREEVRADPSSAPDSGGEALEDRVESILRDGGCYDWDELVAALTDDVEERLEDALQELQAEDRVRYSGRNGGYVLE